MVAKPCPSVGARLRLLAVVVLAAALVPFQVAAQASAERGAYVARAAGCMGCHTDTKVGAVPFSGGRALPTPFGTLYGPNITPDPVHGIGKWSQADFVRAVRSGERPDGSHYYPAFPYTAFAAIRDQDLSDLWAYLRTLPPSAQANRPHDMRFPFSIRALLIPWKWVFFNTPVQRSPIDGSQIARGEYLARALGHCGECHSPRNLLGATQQASFLAGAMGPDGWAPNLTPTRLKKWNDEQLTKFLRNGVTPEGDIASDTMSEVVTNTTSKLTAADLAALVAYLRSIAALPEDKKK